MSVVVNFSGVPVAGKSPLTVQFTDLSTGSPDVWLWFFGDGEYSNLQNPVHVYADGGEYNVTLTAGVKISRDEILQSAATQSFRSGANKGTEALAWADYQTKPWVPTGGVSRFIQHFVVNFEAPITHADTWRYESWKASGTPFNLIPYAAYQLAYLLIRGTSVNQMTPGLIWNMSSNYGPIPTPPQGQGLFLSYEMIVLDVSYALGTKPQLEFYDEEYGRIGLGQARTGNSATIGYSWRGDNVPFVTSVIVAYKFSSWATLTKLAFIRVDMEYCGLGWLMLNRRVDSVPGVSKQLVVETSQKAHLWANYMTRKLLRKTQWKRKYGMRYRCAPKYNLMYKGKVEQAEPDDSLTHTFDMLAMPANKSLKIVLSGEQCGVLHPGRSPIMEYDNTVA
jgi:hypothetical protein